jgi:hypothetical protein
LKQVADLFVLERQLGFVGKVLVLATSAIAKIAATWLDAFRRRLENPRGTGPGKAFFNLEYLRFHHIAHRDKRYEHDKILKTSNPLAPESDVTDVQGQFVARRQRHRDRIPLPAAEQR